MVGFASGGLSAGVAAGLSGSALLELLELLLELEGSDPGRAGGASLGKGCSSAADFPDGDGAGAFGASLGVAAGLAGSPGKGNCSAAAGGFVSVGWVQGLSEEDFAELWLDDGQG